MFPTLIAARISFFCRTGWRILRAALTQRRQTGARPSALCVARLNALRGSVSPQEEHFFAASGDVLVMKFRHRTRSTRNEKPMRRFYRMRLRGEARALRERGDVRRDQGPEKKRGRHLVGAGGSQNRYSRRSPRPATTGVTRPG